MPSNVYFKKNLVDIYFFNKIYCGAIVTTIKLEDTELRGETKNPRTGKVTVVWIATALEMRKITALKHLKRCATANRMQFLIHQEVVKYD